MYEVKKRLWIKNWVKNHLEMDENILICEREGSYLMGDHILGWGDTDKREFLWYVEALDELWALRHPPVIKEKTVKFQQWAYITIAPSKVKRGVIKDKRDLITWAELWFNDKHYDKWKYVIESGKSKDNPFYHIHCIVTVPVKNALRKAGHYSALCENWNKTCMPKLVTKGKSNIQKGIQLTKGDFDVFYQDIKCEELLIQKENYFNNQLKGSHENFEESIVVSNF